jgi:hypothetical protein
MTKKQMTREEKIKSEWHYETDEDGCMELETWTDGGVDMIINVEKGENWLEVFDKYFEDFDIDAEIDMYRQDKNYCANFTIRESVEDFENFVKEWKA